MLKSYIHKTQGTRFRIHLLAGHPSPINEHYIAGGSGGYIRNTSGFP